MVCCMWSLVSVQVVEAVARLCPVNSRVQGIDVLLKVIFVFPVELR